MTEEESIPSYSESYLYGQDVFYTQFNDVSFYVEDSELEELYLLILKKLFPNIRLEKIFPLNGKINVVNDVKLNIGNKSKIYIVDKDFDDLHNRIEDIDNLFYLDRYCIENYFVEQDAIVSFVISENPKIKSTVINDKYIVNSRLYALVNKLLYLNALFYIIQKFNIEVENISKHIDCFLQNKDKTSICTKKLADYMDIVCREIESKSIHIDLEKEVNDCIADWKKKDIELNNTCGKQLLFMLMNDLKQEFSLSKVPNSYSFCYRLADKCKFESLNFLRDNVNSFLSV